MNAQERATTGAAAGLAGFHRVGSAAGLRVGERLLVTVNGQDLVVFRLAEEVVAIPAACPHNGGPICDGELSGSTVSCPWHGYNFDLRTGACEDDADLSLERFEVRVAGDDILIKVQA
jgi:nitrite reductase/ring-hydroxylating ferredoxin subunit